MDLKIGRHTYEVTSKDVFLDNGSCVQLKTQSKEKKISNFDAYPPCPKLSKAAIKKISKFDKIILEKNDHVEYFKLAI